MIWRVFLVLLLLLLWGYQVRAQSDTAVRSELTSLRSRVSRLEGEVRRLSSGRGTQTPSPPVQPGEIDGASDPMFTRLATLVIELKEDVRALQKRVTVLETQPVK